MVQNLVEKPKAHGRAEYASRVRKQALLYVALNILCPLLIVIIAWRAQYFVSLASHSNTEPLVLAIIAVLALYYIIFTGKGLIGALRILWLNAPRLFSGTDETLQRTEMRKQRALKVGRTKVAVCFDKAIRAQGHPKQSLRWDLGDEAGKLGELRVDGVRATYYPLRQGMNNNLFEYFARLAEQALEKRGAKLNLNITEWWSIDADGAAAYYSKARAFDELGERLGGQSLWPSVELTQEDVEEIGRRLCEIVPNLRNEMMLPSLEYSVDYQVPILPEPISFVQLARHDKRADPVLSLGCAVFTMTLALVVLLFIIVLPPWIPSI